MHFLEFGFNLQTFERTSSNATSATMTLGNSFRLVRRFKKISLVFPDLFIKLFLLCLLFSPVYSINDRTCEPIRIEMCKGLGYNMTGMPNLVGHELQQDAELQLQTFTPLIQYGCSTQLKFFLCAVFTPMCTEKVPFSIGPCRPLCQNVKARCQPVLQEFGFPWPASLDCMKFPSENNHQHMCMEGPKPESHETLSSTISHVRTKEISDRRIKPNRHQHKVIPDTRGRDTFTSADIHYHTGESNKRRNFGLCSHFKFFDQYYYINRTQRCAHNCSADILFTSDNKNFSDIWISLWATLCFASTMFTLLTFFVDSNRFQYPERAIILLAVNFNAYSVAYFIRLIAGRNEVSCQLDSQHDVPILIQEGLDNVTCTIVFVLLYFFGMASAVWWVVLTITWFLTAGLKRSPESMQQKCTYFHLAAWGLPSLKTIAILVMRAVDADELTGTCFVGNQNRSTLMLFVILPSLVYLIIGVFFLLCGLCAIYRAKQNCQVCHLRPGSYHSSSSHPHLFTHQALSYCNAKMGEKSEVLMVRIGIFAFFYIIPIGCVTAANFYEYILRESWYHVGTPDRPNVEIFTLKTFMSLVVGIKTGLWIWSSKTPLTTWRKVGKRLIQKKQPLPNNLYLQGNIPPPNQQIITLDRSKRPRVKGGNETAV